MEGVQEKPENLLYTVSLFKNMNSPCKHIWTPVTDEKNESEYRSAIIGGLVRYLPWEVSEPNGFQDENLVLLKISSMGYLDNVNTKKPSCAACDVYRTATFSLTGVCKDTYFGMDRNIKRKRQIIFIL